MSPPLPPFARHWPIPPMDHAAECKPSAFNWAMGRLILQRMGDRASATLIEARRQRAVRFSCLIDLAVERPRRRRRPARA
ncbi:MAG: hypothetical protein ACHP9T_16780 [Caulobacterales bacterium]|jgi:hypothetical protein